MSIFYVNRETRSFLPLFEPLTSTSSLTIEQFLKKSVIIYALYQFGRIFGTYFRTFRPFCANMRETSTQTKKKHANHTVKVGEVNHELELIIKHFKTLRPFIVGLRCAIR